jgi:phosphoglycerate dehydrogenase-like enzyme
MASGRALRVLVHVRATLAERIAGACPDVEPIVVPRDGALPAELAGEVLLTLPWGSPNLAEVLARGVRWVHVLGTGVDGFPVALVGERLLTCSRGASAIPIAEWVLAVMLAFEKRLPESWIHAPVETWGRGRLGTLAGRTLGLVGLGGIGTAVATRALAFGMRVRACRRTPAPSAVPGVEVVGSVAEAAAEADHLVLAAPATAATRHLIDAAVLARAKRGVHLVNVARGALVDQEALRAALDDGPVARASLDAVEPEPLPPGHWMFTHPGVRLSAHVSWNAPGAAEVLVDHFIENLRRWRAGEPLAGVIDREAGY